jgi:hypothetical protein
MRNGISAPDAPTDLAAVQDGADVGLAWTDNATDETGYRIYRSSDGVTYAEIDDIAADSVAYTDVAPGNGTWYYKVAAYNGAGEAVSDAVTTLYFDFSTLADGALPSPFVGATWAITSGSAVNTPTLGSELLVNGNMETGDPPTGWNANAGATLTGVADERTGGAGVQSLNVQRGTNNHCSYKATGSGQVEWHRTSAWLKSIDATEMFILPFPSAGSGAAESRHETSTNWTKAIVSARLTAAAAITMRLNVTDTAGQQGRFDDVSIKKISRPTLFATVDLGISDVNMTAPPATTYRIMTQVGIVLALDDSANPQNFVIAYLHGGLYPLNSQSVVVEECVAGVYTALGTFTIAHDETKHLSAKKSGNQLWVYYGTDDYGTLVGGAALTLNAALVNNTKHGLMSTVEVNSFDGDFTLSQYS